MHMLNFHCPILHCPYPQELCVSVLSKLEAFTVQEISNSIWAMAKLAYYDESLLDKVGQFFTDS